MVLITMVPWDLSQWSGTVWGGWGRLGAVGDGWGRLGAVGSGWRRLGDGRTTETVGDGDGD
jgi:hypothetical protein